MPSDLAKRGLHHALLADLLHVRRILHLRKNRLGQVPARPGTPGPQLLVGLHHPRGEVLPMTPGIADELPFRSLKQQPRDGAIRQRVLLKNRLSPVEGDGQGAIDQKNALGGKPRLPKALRIVERGFVKIRAAGFAKAIQVRRPVQPVNLRQKRTRRIDELRGERRS